MAYGCLRANRSVGSLGVFALALFLGFTPRSDGGQDSPIILALVGDAAPDTAAGTTFSGFETPVLNAGRVAFNASLSGATSSTSSGVWGGSLGNLKLIAREGSQPPSTSTGTEFGSVNIGSPFLTLPRINSSGKVAVWSFLRGTGVTSYSNHGIWAGTSSSQLSLVAQEGNRPPGLSSSLQFASLNFPRVSGTGSVVFHSTIRGPGVTSSTNDTGLWVGGTLVGREGSLVPTLEDGTSFGDMPIYAAVNEFSELAFTVGLRGPNVDTSNNIAFMAGTSQNLTIVIRKGDQAPILDEGVVLTTLRTGGINDSGAVAFYGDLEGPGISEANSEAIWVYGLTDTSLVAQRGEAPLGLEPGVRFADFSDVRLSGGGDVVFTADLDGTEVTSSNDVGIWLWSSDGLQLAAREGSPAMGVAPGARLRTLTNYGVNSLGQVMFGATLTGAGVTSANDKGIWVTDADGHAQLILRERQTIEVSAGDARTIGSWSVDGGSGGQDGGPTGFDDLGGLAVELRFTDGTEGVALFETLPEPGSCAHPDADRDQDIDLRDISLFQLMFEDSGMLDCCGILTTGLTGP